MSDRDASTLACTLPYPLTVVWLVYEWRSISASLTNWDTASGGGGGGLLTDGGGERGILSGVLGCYYLAPFTLLHLRGSCKCKGQVMRDYV